MRSFNQGKGRAYHNYFKDRRWISKSIEHRRAQASPLSLPGSLPVNGSVASRDPPAGYSTFTGTMRASVESQPFDTRRGPVWRIPRENWWPGVDAGVAAIHARKQKRSDGICGKKTRCIAPKFSMAENEKYSTFSVAVFCARSAAFRRKRFVRCTKIKFTRPAIVRNFHRRYRTFFFRFCVAFRLDRNDRNSSVSREQSADIEPGVFISRLGRKHAAFRLNGESRLVRVHSQTLENERGEGYEVHIG